MIDDDDFVTNSAQRKQLIKQNLAIQANDVLATLQADPENPDKLRHNVQKPDEEIKAFTDELISSVVEIGNVKESVATRKIREAERYFNAEYNRDLILVNVTDKGDERIIQVDVNLNHQLSDEQKQEYLKIHGPEQDRPQWFKDLDKHEQNWYLNKVPKATVGDTQSWQSFEGLFKPSSMQGTPGNSNLRVHTLMREEGGEVSLLSTSIKCGSPVSYEMAEEARIVSTEQNIKQVAW